MGKVIGLVALIIVVVLIVSAYDNQSAKDTVTGATATAAVATSAAVGAGNAPPPTTAPLRVSSTSVGNTGSSQQGITVVVTATPQAVQQAQIQSKAGATCTSGAIVQIADDGSIWMPNGNPSSAYDCEFTPSQTKQLYWKGTNAELSVTGSGVLIPMKGGDKWIQINAGTTYHVRGLGMNGGFALQTYES